MDTIKVVCGIIFNKDKIFICRRKPEKSLGGYWEFPGGKIEPDENEEETLIRELKEELDMQVEIEDYYTTSSYDYDTFSIELIAYKCILLKYKSKLIDHDKFEWVEPIKLLDHKLAPADIPLAQRIINKL